MTNITRLACVAHIQDREPRRVLTSMSLSMHHGCMCVCSNSGNTNVVVFDFLHGEIKRISIYEAIREVQGINYRDRSIDGDSLWWRAI